MRQKGEATGSWIQSSDTPQTPFLVTCLKYDSVCTEEEERAEGRTHRDMTLVTNPFNRQSSGHVLGELLSGGEKQVKQNLTECQGL